MSDLPKRPVPPSPEYVGEGKFPRRYGPEIERLKRESTYLTEFLDAGRQPGESNEAVVRRFVAEVATLRARLAAVEALAARWEELAATPLSGEGFRSCARAVRAALRGTGET